MSKIKETFITIINEGHAATKQITDSAQKAQALAQIAQAIAQSGLLVDHLPLMSTATGVVTLEDPIKEEATGKDSLKASAGKGKSKSKAKTVVKEEIVEEVQEEAPAPEVEETAPEVVEDEIIDDKVENEDETVIEETWTEDMLALKADQINTLSQYAEAWTEECVYGECLQFFCEDKTITPDQAWEYIRPTNIDGFIAYLISISDQ